MAKQRNKGGGDDGGGERWLTTYGDAITLLMAFFVMLYAMSTVDVEKFKAFVSGLEGPFDNKSIQDGLLDNGPGIVGPMGGQPTSNEGVGVTPDAVRLAPPPPPPQQAHPSQQPSEAAVPDQLGAVQAQIEASIAAAGLSVDLVDFRRNEHGLVVSVATDDVLFASGSARVVETGQQLIAAVAAALRQFSNSILVEGHTDNVPLRRGGYTNWNLSTDRAVAVLSLLLEQHGIPPQRLGAVGYGEHRPRIANDTSEHRALNRRVDILVTAQGGARNG